MLLDELLSGDGGRVWSASFDVIHLADPAQLSELASRLEDIEAYEAANWHGQDWGR